MVRRVGAVIASVAGSAARRGSGEGRDRAPALPLGPVARERA